MALDPAAQRLAGKVAIITGGVSGMGLGTVRLFLEHGARVVVGDVQDEPGRRLEGELGDNFRYQRCDVSVEADVAALVQRGVDAGPVGRAGIGRHGASATARALSGPSSWRNQARALSQSRRFT